MRFVGLHYNRSPNDRTKKRSPSPSLVNRISLIDAHLRQAGRRVITYCPQQIDPTADTISGFVSEGREYLPLLAPIPVVNGNWTHRTRRLIDQEGMGYQRFGRWAEERGVWIFVPLAFSELLGNKLETYKLVRGFHETLHPHCEAYARSEKQLEHFVETGRRTFVKPRSGSKGNLIVTIVREQDGLSVTHYEKRVRKRRRVKTLTEAHELVRRLTEPKKRYVIQHGVETVRHDGSTFDIRVTMLNDGYRWHWLHEARLSRTGSDVSNVSQGGEIVVTEDLLFHVMGGEAARQLLYEVKSDSFGLAAYLDQLHPGEILEVAFDFVVDLDGRVRLLEINTKPGLAGIGSEVSVFEKKPEHEAAFERWVYPHTTHLASFLLHKAEQLAP
jgi:glutathione synthase/RimK-type ligase-like ATP-grasp enzyme